MFLPLLLQQDAFFHYIDFPCFFLMTAILSSKIRSLRNHVRVVEGDAMEEE